jgi:lipopolysaccharide transport protein LptA
LITFGCLYLPLSVSKENINFQNISIHSEQVTIDEETRKLAFKNNIKIEIDGYIINGSDAFLSYEDEKLEIYGKPATIKSNFIDGEAEVFVIYPNKSINLVGNARLINKGNSITSNLIAYQISSNE